MAIASLVLVASLAGGARGDDGAEAARMFQRASELADTGQHAEACALFAQSYQLERAPGTLLNLGVCAERAGKLRRAWLYYDAAAREYGATQKARQAQFARERKDALAPKLATLVLRIAEPQLAGIAVRVGNDAAPAGAEIVERVDPGAVEVVVSAPGRESFSTTARAARGEQVVVEIPALRPVARPEPIGRVEPNYVDGGRRRGRVLLAVAIAGAGAAALAVSGGLGVSANRAYQKPFDRGLCTDAGDHASCTTEGQQQIRSAERRADIATAVGIGGAAALAAGAIVYFTAPRERMIAPLAAPHTVGITVSGRF